MTEAELYGIDVKELAKEAPDHPEQHRFGYLLSQRWHIEWRFWTLFDKVQNHKNVNDPYRKQCANLRDMYVSYTKQLRYISQNVRQDDRIVNYGRRKNG